MTVTLLWAAVAAAATGVLASVGRFGFVFLPFLFLGFGGRRDARPYLGAAAGAVAAGLLLRAPVAALGGFGVALVAYAVSRLFRRSREPEPYDGPGY